MASFQKILEFLPEGPVYGPGLRRRENRRIVIAESLARVTRCHSISLAFVGGRISLESIEFSPHRPCVRCAAIRISQLVFIRATFVPHGIGGMGLPLARELTAFVER